MPLLAGWLLLLSCATPVLAGEPAVPLFDDLGQPILRNSEELRKVQAALPTQAPASRPAKARRLLVFNLNVNYGGHGSIPYASQAIQLMGGKTGAFKTFVSRNPAVFRPENLRQFDAVFFNNNVGNLFEDPALRKSLVEFVYRGGGLLGVHGATVAFTRWPGAQEDWPEFGILLGARGANHRENTEHVFIKLDDPGHPLNQPFGREGFEYRDEFFRVHGPYSRERVRVLFSIDTVKTDLQQGRDFGRVERADGDYALAWVRNYGRGRIFYCTIAHNPYVFYDPTMLKFYLGAIQYALGDLPAPTTPNARLTPAVRAQEQLGWRFGLAAGRNETLFDSIDRAARHGLLYLQASRSQAVSADISQPFDEKLGDDALRQIRLKLDVQGVRLLAYQVPAWPANAESLVGLFDFAARMGVQTVVTEAIPDHLERIEAACDRHNLGLALSRAGETANLLRDRSRFLGACVEYRDWLEAGRKPATIASTFKERLMTLKISTRAQQPGNEPPFDVRNATALLQSLRTQQVKPVVITFEAAGADEDGERNLKELLNRFNEAVVELLK